MHEERWVWKLCLLGKTVIGEFKNYFVKVLYPLSIATICQWQTTTKHTARTLTYIQMSRDSWGPPLGLCWTAHFLHIRVGWLSADLGGAHLDWLAQVSADISRAKASYMAEPSVREWGRQGRELKSAWQWVWRTEAMVANKHKYHIQEKFKGSWTYQ